MSSQKSSSVFWYLLPFVLAIIGGVITFFILRNSDSGKARNCLIMGVVITAIGIIGNVLFNADVMVLPNSEYAQGISQYIETYGFTAFLTGVMISVVVTVGIGLVLYNYLIKKIKSKPIVYSISIAVSVGLYILYQYWQQWSLSL